MHQVLCKNEKRNVQVHFDEPKLDKALGGGLLKWKCSIFNKLADPYTCTPRRKLNSNRCTL